MRDQYALRLYETVVVMLSHVESVREFLLSTRHDQIPFDIPLEFPHLLCFLLQSYTLRAQEGKIIMAHFRGQIGWMAHLAILASLHLY